MAANGSPELVFTPSNDIDNYTMATAYINEEFAGIRVGENDGNDRTHNKTHNKRKINNDEIVTKIKEALMSNPDLSAEELAHLLNATPGSVRYRLRKLRENGEIKRFGSKKNGSWKVLG